MYVVYGLFVCWSGCVCLKQTLWAMGLWLGVDWLLKSPSFKSCSLSWPLLIFIRLFASPVFRRRLQNMIIFSMTYFGKESEIHTCTFCTLRRWPVITVCELIKVRMTYNCMRPEPNKDEFRMWLERVRTSNELTRNKHRACLLF